MVITHCPFRGTLCRPVNRNNRQIACIILCSSSKKSDVAVIGAGAAGLTAAFFAARFSNNNTNVTLYEKNNESGKKILISGGTRCNILPALYHVDDYIDSFTTESSKSAMRAVFKSWSLDECRQWLEDEIGIELTLEEETQKLFPTSNSAKEVRDKLVKACIDVGVKFEYGAALKDMSSSLECVFTNGMKIQPDKVILATGGKSFPSLGTDGTGYDIVKRLGHQLHEPYPALTPLQGHHPGGHQLAGLSMYDVALLASASSVPNTTDSADSTKKKKGKKKKKKSTTLANRSAILFTHRGFSGPAILDLSQTITREYERGNPDAAGVLSINWQQDKDQSIWEDLLQDALKTSGNTQVTTFLRKNGLPNRLADALVAEAGIPEDRKLSEIRKQERLSLLDVLTDYQLDITGHEGYAKAEVTGGGVPLEEIDVACMQSRIIPGLYLAGEMCDVHGRIGGFNFLWAWMSGRCASRSIND